MMTALQGAPLAVRGGKKLPGAGIERILIRGTNWIGDVVMTLPALAAIRKTWPGARITVLAKPWVSEIYRLSPDVDEVFVFQEPGRHAGVMGKLRLAGELRKHPFDCAILLQNAIEAAILARLAGISLRAGYNSDGRGLLLTHSVRRTREVRQVHQIDYYLEMVRALGCTPGRAERSTAPRRGLRWRGGKAAASLRHRGGTTSDRRRPGRRVWAGKDVVSGAIRLRRRPPDRRDRGAGDSFRERR